MRRAPHREARHRQRDQARHDQRVQEEIERRREHELRESASTAPTGSSENSARPALRIAIHEDRARRDQQQRRSTIVRPWPRAADRVRRRQSSSGPASSSSSSAASASSAAIQPIADALPRAPAGRVGHCRPPRAARSVGERMTNASGPASAAPSNCSRSATGTMLVSSENSEPGSAVCRCAAAALRRRSRRCGARARPDRQSAATRTSCRPWLLCARNVDAGPDSRASGTSSDRPEPGDRLVGGAVDRDRDIGSRPRWPPPDRTAAACAPASPRSARRSDLGVERHRAHGLIEPVGERRELALHLGPEPGARRRQVAAQLRSARSPAPRPRSPRRPPGRRARCASPRA